MNNNFMKSAYEEAIKAYEENEVPVGAVIVHNGEIIGKAHNIKNTTQDIFDHAEIIAIKEASKKINDWRLFDCEMYVTLEPCPMCAGAIVQSRIKKVYIGTSSSNNGNIIKQIFSQNDCNHVVEFDYLNDINCSKILSNFFEQKR